MHEAIIHNGEPIELSDRKIYAQIPLGGGGKFPFGSKALQFDDTHFRLFRGDEKLVCFGDCMCLILDLGGKQAIRRLGGRMMIKVRIPQGDSVHDKVRRLAGSHAGTSPPVLIGQDPAVLELRREVIERCQQVRDRIDQLPGRSLYKRVDTYLRLEQARDYLEHHFRDDPSTEVLASQAAISRAHFIRLFGKLYGISPKQRVLELKIGEARRLLRETGMSVWQVAEASGFGNRSAFQRMFRQRMGLTPARYRQREKRRAAGRR